MATKPRFEEGDYVVLKSDPDGWTWEILERKGKRYLVGDVGYETSHIIKNWHDEDELETAPDDEDEIDDSDPDEFGDPFDGFAGDDDFEGLEL